MQKTRLFVLALAGTCLVSNSKTCPFAGAVVGYSHANPFSPKFHASIS